MIARGKALLGLLALSLFVAACGADSSEGNGAAGAGGADGAAAVAIGTSPTLSNAALYYANSSGLFADNGLKATISPIQSGAAAIPLLLNGQLQFTASDPGAAMVAINKNVPLVMVATGNISAADADHDSTAILVRDDGKINSVADLAGKTFGVNALNSVAHLTSRRTIDKLGGDSTKVNFVELPLPQSVDAVVRGQVDAVVVNEPFATQGLAAGLKILARPFSEAIPGVPQLVYVTSKSYASQHPDAVKAFADAIHQANGYLADHPDEIKTIGKTSTQTPPELLEKIVLPTFVNDPLTTKMLQPLMQLMVDYKVLPGPIDLDKVIASP